MTVIFKNYKLKKINGRNKKEAFYLIVDPKDTMEYGFVRKFNNTKTDEFPWQGFVYGDIRKGVMHEDCTLVCSIYGVNKKFVADKVMEKLFEG